MKTKFSILFTLLVLLFSCKANKLEETPNPQDAKPFSDVLSTDEALEQLYGFIDAMSPATRADGGFSRAKGISQIKVSGGSMTTRGTQCDVPDTLVYVVNFENDGGFAVLGARRTVEPIFALTESGSLDAEKLNAAIAEVQQRMLNKDKAPTRSSDDNEPFQEIGPDIIYPLLAEAMTAPTPRIAEMLISEDIGSWINNTTVGPLVEVKWGQSYPFNICIPNNRLTGCAIVAAAQIMSCTRKPALAPGTQSRTYSWTQLLTVANYLNTKLWQVHNSTDSLNYMATATPTQKLYTQHLSNVMYRLGDQTCFKAIYNPTSTPVKRINIIPGLISIDPYYANAQIYTLTSSIYSLIYKSLDNSKPIYVMGVSSKGGHGWVLDGYIKQSRKITRLYRLGYTGPIRTETKTETRNLWHLNMGWAGDNDGYFAEAIFNMPKRISTDPKIDKNIKDTLRSSAYNFSTNMEVILY